MIDAVTTGHGIDLYCRIQRTTCNRLKQWRGLATRYEKTATVYRVGLLIAGIFPWSAR